MVFIGKTAKRGFCDQNHVEKYWCWYVTYCYYILSRCLVIFGSQELLVTMATTWWRRFWLCSNIYLAMWRTYKWTCWNSQVCSEPPTPRAPWPPAVSHRPSECISDDSLDHSSFIAIASCYYHLLERLGITVVHSDHWSHFFSTIIWINFDFKCDQLKD